MKKHILMAAALVVGLSHAEPTKVLMIGNSYSICVLKEMPKICADLGIELDLCSLYIGGCSLARHSANLVSNATPYLVTWNYCGKTGRDAVPFGKVIDDAKSDKVNLLRGMIAADKWDIVTIQQASPESWKPSNYEPYGSNLIAAIRELAPQAKIYVQQTWSYTPLSARLTSWRLDENSMYDKLSAAYAAFAARHGLTTIRTGEAVQRFRRELPVVFEPHVPSKDDIVGKNVSVKRDGNDWVVSGDCIHLNERGEFLQGLVWTAKIFNADVEKSTYTPKYMANRTKEVALMRHIAASLR